MRRANLGRYLFGVQLSTSPWTFMWRCTRIVAVASLFVRSQDRRLLFCSNIIICGICKTFFVALLIHSYGIVTSQLIVGCLYGGWEVMVSLLHWILELVAFSYFRSIDVEVMILLEKYRTLVVVEVLSLCRIKGRFRH